MERIPLLVGGSSLVAILKLKTSGATFHWMLRALSMGVWSRSKPLTEATLSDSEMESMVLRE